MLNLGNLIPVWQLDGACGLRPLSRSQRWALLAVIAFCYAMLYKEHQSVTLNKEDVLPVIGVGVLLRSIGPGHQTGDRVVLRLFAFLIVALSALTQVTIQL
jgi:Zn-dependent protease